MPPLPSQLKKNPQPSRQNQARLRRSRRSRHLSLPSRYWPRKHPGRQWESLSCPEEEPAAVATAPVPAVDAASLVASFAADYDPVVFTRESPAGFTVLPISQSRFWGEAGTRLESLDGVTDGSSVRLVLQTGDGFSAEVSYFLYLFGERTLGRENAVTLEILPLARGGRGACVLWQRGEGEAAAGASRPLPRLIGSVTSWGRTCTVEIAIDELPPRP